MVVGGNQSGKGAKGLLMGKGAAVPVVDDKKDKKKPTSRSSRAGLQVRLLNLGSVCIVGRPVSFLVGFRFLGITCEVCPGLGSRARGEWQSWGDVASTALNVGKQGGDDFSLICNAVDVGACIVVRVGVVLWHD